MIAIRDWKVSGEMLSVASMRHYDHTRTDGDSQASNKGNSVAVGEKDEQYLRDMAYDSDVRKSFLKQIHVNVEIEAPVFWWMDLAGTNIEYTLSPNDFSSVAFTEPLEKDQFTFESMTMYGREALTTHINRLNEMIRIFQDLGQYEMWQDILNLMPCGFMYFQTISISMYELIHLYQHTQNKTTPEWKRFNAWCEFIPNFKLYLKAFS